MIDALHMSRAPSASTDRPTIEECYARHRAFVFHRSLRYGAGDVAFAEEVNELQLALTTMVQQSAMQSNKDRQVADIDPITTLVTGVAATDYLTGAFGARGLAWSVGNSWRVAPRLLTGHWRWGSTWGTLTGKITDFGFELTPPGLGRRALRLGHFDPPEGNPFAQLDPKEYVQSPAHQDLSLRAALRSFVLLKNLGNFLPLTPGTLFDNLAVSVIYYLNF